MPIPYKLLYLSGAGGAKIANTPLGNAEQISETIVDKTFSELGVTREKVTMSSGTVVSGLMKYFDTTEYTRENKHGIYSYAEGLIEIKYGDYDTEGVTFQLDQIAMISNIAHLPYLIPNSLNSNYYALNLPGFHEIRYKTISNGKKISSVSTIGSTSGFSFTSPYPSINGSSTGISAINLNRNATSYYFPDKLAEALDLENTKVKLIRRVFLYDKPIPDEFQNLQFSSFLEKRSEYFE